MLHKKKNKDNSIKKIVDNNLCIGCGACYSGCPKDAISMQIKNGAHKPIINNNCINCGKCLGICPSYDLNYDYFYEKYYKNKKFNNYFGPYINCYTGFSSDKKIRYSSSSGGLVTQLLLYALRNKIIDCAITTTFNSSILVAKPIIASTQKEIVGSSGSKYFSVDQNSIFKDRGKLKGKKIAFVGLPCHLLALAKMMEKDKDLEKSITLKLGLFCGKLSDYYGLNFILKKFNVQVENIRKINVRTNGWPGEMEVIYKDQTKKAIKNEDYYSYLGSYLFSLRRCIQCPDLYSSLSDISFGDAWLKRFNADKLGTSLIITRTDKGEELTKKAFGDKEIIINKISLNDAVASQIKNNYVKRKNLKLRLSILRVFCKKTLSIKDKGIDSLEPNKLSIFDSLRIIINCYISKNKFFIKIFNKAPIKLIKLYLKLSYFLAKLGDKGIDIEN